MMQLIHHYQNNQCSPGQDEQIYCNGIYGLGALTEDGMFSTHIDGYIMDR